MRYTHEARPGAGTGMLALGNSFNGRLPYALEEARAVLAASATAVASHSLRGMILVRVTNSQFDLRECGSNRLGPAVRVALSISNCEL